MCKDPVISSETITPHAEAWQAVIWHLIVTDPRIISYSNKWESIEKNKIYLHSPNLFGNELKYLKECIKKIILLLVNIQIYLQNI